MLNPYVEAYILVLYILKKQSHEKNAVFYVILCMN